MAKKNNERDFWALVSSPTTSGCMEWEGYKMKSGYGRFRFNGKRVLAHRLAYVLAFGEIPKHETHHGTLVVCHRCDNPLCCNPKHLFLGTQADNIADRDKKGRVSRVSRGKGIITHAKLSPEIVSEAKRLFTEKGFSKSALARKFNVSASTMNRAIRGKTWNI